MQICLQLLIKCVSTRQHTNAGPGIYKSLRLRELASKNSGTYLILHSSW
jgi:hypothetical protein